MLRKLFSGKTLIIISAFMFAGIFAPAFAASEKITIKGSTTVLPIAQVAAEIFMDRNPSIDISVQGGGSGVGIAALIDGTTDIADASRKIKSKEIEKAQAKGINPNEIVVAMDGIAVILHPSNKIEALNRTATNDIYTGKISNWSELGGPNKKIVIISRDSSSGTFETFEGLALNKEKVRADALTAASNQAVAQTVAQTPGAIGYVGLGYLTPKVKDIRVDGVKCTKKTILSGDYALARPLHMYTSGKPKGSVKKFVDFVLSAEGQKLAEEEGFVGLQ